MSSFSIWVLVSANKSLTIIKGSISLQKSLISWFNVKRSFSNLFISELISALSVSKIPPELLNSSSKIFFLVFKLSNNSSLFKIEEWC